MGDLVSVVYPHQNHCYVGGVTLLSTTLTQPVQLIEAVAAAVETQKSYITIRNTTNNGTDNVNHDWQCHDCSYSNDERTSSSWFSDVNVDEDVAAPMCIMCDAFQPCPCTVTVEEFDSRCPQCSYLNNEEIWRAVFGDSDDRARLCNICYSLCPHSSQTQKRLVLNLKSKLEKVT
jgi:hypothetical protein